MEMSGLMVFAAAVIALQAAPGPVVAVALSRAISRDHSGCIAFCFGVCIGQLVPIAMIALGFAVWVQGNGELLTVFRFLGSAYMLWLALQMWRAPQFGTAAASSPGGWLTSAGAGAAICLGSPYTIVFYVLMLPSVAPNGLADLTTVGTVMLISIVMTAGTLAVMMMLAAQLYHVFSSPRLSKVFNRVIATLLAGTSVLLLVA